MKNGLFDETFRGYGYEDLELGCRLAQKDFRIIYNDRRDRGALQAHDLR